MRRILSRLRRRRRPVMNRYEFSGWNRFGWKVSSTIYAADLETAAQIFDGELRKTEALR